MRQRSRTRNVVEYLVAQCVLTVLRLAPAALARQLARWCASLLRYAVPRLRCVALHNLAVAMPELDAADRELIADGVFNSIARNLFTFARCPSIDRGNVGDFIRYEGYEHFEAALARGKGVLFATAHLGNWELSAFAHALLSAPMHIVIRPLDNPLLHRLVERRRTASGNHLIEKRDFARGILKALAANQAVGILVDQNTASDQGVFINFFGLPACTAPVFARIAARTGAAVIPGFALWSETDQRFVLHFYPPIPITGDALADTQAIQTHLESVIRAHPGQWLWIHRRWKTQPPGTPSLYASPPRPV